VIVWSPVRDRGLSPWTTTDIVRLDVFLLTRRGFPVAHVKVPVVDLREFLHEAQQRDPSATYGILRVITYKRTACRI